jgi:glutaredoxin
MNVLVFQKNAFCKSRRKSDSNIDPRFKKTTAKKERQAKQQAKQANPGQAQPVSRPVDLPLPEPEAMSVDSDDDASSDADDVTDDDDGVDYAKKWEEEATESQASPQVLPLDADKVWYK